MSNNNNKKETNIHITRYCELKKLTPRQIITHYSIIVCSHKSSLQNTIYSNNTNACMFNPPEGEAEERVVAPRGRGAIHASLNHGCQMTLGRCNHHFSTLVCDYFSTIGLLCLHKIL